MNYEQARAMGYEELEAKVAELCGGVLKTCECGAPGCVGGMRWHWPDGRITDFRPAYANDLDAMRDAVKAVLIQDTNNEGKPCKEAYIRALMVVVAYAPGALDAIARNPPGTGVMEGLIAVEGATARQKAEALVVVVGEA